MSDPTSDPGSEEGTNERGAGMNEQRQDDAKETAEIEGCTQNDRKRDKDAVKGPHIAAGRR